ncbi:MAG: hypothetical protein OEW67_11750 [Cyclobacteriaceae bacterium]|nr:hypothetical protein [Cyclobacteriaceae bacterium]
MQKLTLYEDVFDALDTGKTTTIRKGRISISLGELLLQSTALKREETVLVKMVYFCLLKDVMQDDIINDGFDDHDDMSEKMKRFYPDITLETEVTVVRFIRLNL